MKRNTCSVTMLVLVFLAGCSGSGSDSSGKADHAAPPPAETPAADTATPPAASSGLINPNTAGEAELMSVPHASAELVQGILANRPFDGMPAFDAFLPASLDSAARAELYGALFIPLDLNTASNEEMFLIPGVGPKMAHEFEEYRPWTSVEQFRREIGKYVDESEVARLERYVRIAG